MKPKNQRERIERFLKFFLLFAITVALLLCAAYFNYKIPKEENRQLRYEVKKSEQEFNFQKDFFKDMKHIDLLLDSLSTGELVDSKVPYIENVLEKDLGKLLKKIPSEDSTANYQMYQNIVRTYYNYHESQRKLRSVKDASEKIEQLQAELTSCQDEIENLKRENNILQLRD